MWLPLIVYLFVNIKNISSFELTTENEPADLTDLFIENLKVDPVLLGDRAISDKSKRFINEKINTFVHLVSQSQNAEFSRTKRSLDDRDTSESRYSINIFPHNIVPTQYSEDIRLFRQENRWFAVALEDKNDLVIYQYLNESFYKLLQKDIQYFTNLAVLSIGDVSLVVVGENEHVNIFQFHFKEKRLSSLQRIQVANSKHVVLWEQDDAAYLSITDSQQNHSENAQNEMSTIKVYQWLGSHFDHVQDIRLFNIKKIVPFSIHGSHFLAAVKYQKDEGEVKSYSDIFKFDQHLLKFELHQRLLTNGCTDIKYFTSILQGENHHFLVVVYNANNDPTTENESISVIYKYEDKYFIAFQRITTNSVEWQPVQDSKGNAALISVTTAGLQGFQFDGWYFFESPIVSNEELRYEDIKTLHTYDFDGKRIFVIACDHCKDNINIYSVNFTNFNAIKDLHSQALSWCTDSLKQLESNDQSEVVGESLRGDLNEHISEDEDQKRQLSAAITESNEVLHKIEDAFNSSFLSDDDHIFEDHIAVDTIIFNNAATISSLHAPAINEINIDSLLENVLNIKEGFTLNEYMEISVVVSGKELTPKELNNVPLDRYVTLNNDISLDNLIVNGSVTFKSGVNVESPINNVNVTEKKLLLKDGDQFFSGSLAVVQTLVDHLTTKSLNGLNLEDFNSDSQEISHIEYLKVKDLVIGGVLNRVSVPVLAQRCLKKFGDQILDKTLYFNTLNVGSINIGGYVSGKQVPSDFALINSGEFVVNQDVVFLTGLNTNKLEVLYSLNNISVTGEGHLDILLSDVPYIQSVPTKKTFDHLVITNPINIRNKINNAKMQRISPVIVDSELYLLDGDVTINGRANITRHLEVEDLKSQDGNKSLSHVLENGIKVSDTQIPVHLTFTQPLDLEDVFADRVNFLNPHDWLLETSNSTQVVRGRKRFLGDLRLNGGHVDAFRINDVDVHAMERGVLKIEGDQELDGVLIVDKVVAKEGVISNNLYLGNLNKSEEKTQHSDVWVIDGDLKVENLTTTHLEVRGLINLQNISNILRNIVRKDADYKIFGEKKFKELRARNLVIHDRNSELLQLLKDVITDQITLNGNLDLFNQIQIENMKFGKNINGISTENFDSMMNMKSGSDNTTVVSSSMEYDEIVVFGEVFVQDNCINSKNLTSIEEDTVKADEDHEFDDVNFGEAVIVNRTLNLDGNVENLDLDSIVKQSPQEIMRIQDKVFMGPMFINGTLYINNTVNGVDLKKFCQFSQPSEKLKTLKIEGDVVFVRGPKILNINNLSVKDLKDTLWFRDEAAIISGTVLFKNTTFKDSLRVLEFVDTTNLSLMSKNYLSKSKHQVVTANLAFDDVTFSNISTPALRTKGPINGILIDDLLKTMLIQGEDQIFESPAYLEEVKVQGLNVDTDYTVNGLNLKTDVMRYDQPNVVTGQKILKNLNIEILNLTHNVTIQNVDVLDWLANAILVKGTFKINGRKLLKSGTFKQGLSVRGKVNNQNFNEETVMLVNIPQNVTGKKSFFTDDKEPTKFNTLRIKGLVNDIDLEKLTKNQANRHQNTTLNSEVVFSNSMVVKNINVDVIYNNVNVSELIASVRKFRNLESFHVRFQDLLDVGIEVQHSLKTQATFFKYYKEIVQLENVYDVFGVKCNDGVFRLVAFCWENNTNVFRTFEWYAEDKTFILSGETIESHSKPNYMRQLSLGDKDYLYIEHLLDYEAQDYRSVYSGRLLQLADSTTLELAAEFHRNATVSFISFVNPGLSQHCLGFIGYTLSGMDIFCDETGQHVYYWAQRIRMDGVYKATTVETQDSVYLFLARHGLPYKEPSIVVFQSSVGYPDFIEIQTIFEGADLNGLTAALIGGVPYVTFSFGSQEATVESGWVSVRRLDMSSNQFLQWQHVPITAPLGAHFVTQTSFEPLLLVPSADASAPLHILRYDGIAGFIMILKGSSLPISSEIRIIGNGHFLVALQDDRYVGTVLGAIVKGSVAN